jgi:hypothetical protein
MMCGAALLETHADACVLQLCWQAAAGAQAPAGGAAHQRAGCGSGRAEHGQRNSPAGTCGAVAAQGECWWGSQFQANCNAHLVNALVISAPAPSAPAYSSHQVLGRVEPGGSLPLPQDWRADNKQLQFRPLLQEQQQQQPGSAQAVPPSHAWSYGVSNGQQAVVLAAMEDGASRLLCCPTLGSAEAADAVPVAAAGAVTAAATLSPRKAAAAAPSCWFSALCEATELPLQVCAWWWLCSCPSNGPAARELLTCCAPICVLHLPPPLPSHRVALTRSLTGWSRRSRPSLCATTCQWQPTMRCGSDLHAAAARCCGSGGGWRAAPA